MSSLPPTRLSFPSGHVSEELFPSSSTRAMADEVIGGRNEVPVVPAADKVKYLSFCSRNQRMGEYCWSFSTLLCLSDAWIREKIQEKCELLNPRKLFSPADIINSCSKKHQQVNEATENDNNMGPYTRRQLMEEHCRGVSTLLSLSDPWRLKKMLTRSEILSWRTLLLPPNVINNPGIPFLGDKFPRRIQSQGVRVTVYDADTKTDHRLFVLKRWGYSTTYVLAGRWKEEFIKRRQLKDGDEIGLYWDSTRFKFIFSVLRRAKNFI